MKLWVRVSAIVMVVLVLVLGINSALTVLDVRRTTMELAVQNALRLHESAAQLLAQETQFYGQSSRTEMGSRALLLHLLSERLGRRCALVQAGEVVFTSLKTELDDAIEAPADADIWHTVMEVDDRSMVLVGGYVQLLGKAYVFFTEHDITGIAVAASGISTRALLLGAFSALLGACLVIVLMRRATRPLQTLAQAARRMAAGDYHERVRVSTWDEVGSLAHDFNAMADAVGHTVDELTAASQRQELFIQALSHEMKTPVTAITGHAETLLTTAMPQAVQEEALAQIYAQSKRMERLSQRLTSLLLLGGGVQAKEVSVPELLEDVREATKKLLESRGTPLVITCSVETLLLDEDLIVSALVNLVDNASKASAPGQEIHLTATGEGFTVRDHGRGIPAEDIPHLAEPFFTCDASRSRTMGGAGLGFSIVQRIAQAHGARIIVASVPGEGTCIQLLFQ